MNTKIKKDLAFRRIAGELFIVDAARAEMHELNGTAAIIWEGLAAGRTEKAIIAALLSEFAIEEKAARADLAGFVNELKRTGLLE